MVLMYCALVGMLGVHPQSHIYNHMQKEGWPIISQRIFHWKISASRPSLLIETRKLYLGLQDFYHKLSTAWSVSHQLDPHHHRSRQEKKARGAQFSLGFLPSHIRTKDDRQRALSKNIRARCSHIIERLTRLGSGDLQKMLPKLPYVRAATILCYSGNCSRCVSDSLVCTGISEGCWWVKSAFLPTHAITYLKMDDKDKNIMAVILEMRLSEAAVISVSSNTSTQKVEAFNRATFTTLNKETNYKRNFGGRLAT